MLASWSWDLLGPWFGSWLFSLLLDHWLGYCAQLLVSAIQFLNTV